MSPDASWALVFVVLVMAYAVARVLWRLSR